jgi:hypothetical protein
MVLKISSDWTACQWIWAALAAHVFGPINNSKLREIYAKDQA